jgi:hypothetical protein
LLRILMGRREKILRRYLGRLSPLADPELRVPPNGQALCVDDLAVSSGVAPASRRYLASLRHGSRLQWSTALQVAQSSPGHACALLPSTPASRVYSVVEFHIQGERDAPAQLDVHVYRGGDEAPLIAGLERPPRADD